MRHWINPLLVTGLLILGVAVFVLERRVSGLELELRAERSRIPVTSNAIPVGGAVSPLLDGRGIPQRRPAGEINGVPYYHLELSRSQR